MRNKNKYLESNMKKFMNNDQINFLKSKTGTMKSFKWSTALYFMNTIGADLEEVTITAFFCGLINEWFDILNNRYGIWISIKVKTN